MMKNAFWIHGGPGFNTFHEKAILGSSFNKAGIAVEFWNEPSQKRPHGDTFESENAFEGWKKSLAQTFFKLLLKSGNQKITIIAHSFGCHGAIHLLENFEYAIDQVILVAPSLNLREGLRSIAQLAAQDFEESDLQKNREIVELLQKSKSHYNPDIKKALEISLTDPKLLTHYWIDQEKMINWLQSYSQPESSLDLESFWSVLGSMSFEHLLAKRKFSVPCTALFGEYDPVSQEINETALIKSFFKEVFFLEMKQVAHYPHLEKPEKFTDMITERGSVQEDLSSKKPLSEWSTGFSYNS